MAIRLLIVLILSLCVNCVSAVPIALSPENLILSFRPLEYNGLRAGIRTEINIDSGLLLFDRELGSLIINVGFVVPNGLRVRGVSEEEDGYIIFPGERGRLTANVDNLSGSFAYEESLLYFSSVENLVGLLDFDNAPDLYFLTSRSTHSGFCNLGAGCVIAHSDEFLDLFGRPGFTFSILELGEGRFGFGTNVLNAFGQGNVWDNTTISGTLKLNQDATEVPEPATLFLLLASSMFGFRKKFRKTL